MWDTENKFGMIGIFYFLPVHTCAGAVIKQTLKRHLSSYQYAVYAFTNGFKYMIVQKVFIALHPLAAQLKQGGCLSIGEFHIPNVPGFKVGTGNFYQLKGSIGQFNFVFHGIADS